MAANLPHELTKFHKNCRLLRRILRETKKSFTEIRISGQFEGEHNCSIDFTPEQEKVITDVTDCPPCIVVLGQNRWAKACIINELFNQPIIPMLVDRKKNDVPDWRMVKFKYGNCNQITLALPNSYELVEKLEAYEQPWRTIPRGDLELKNGVDEDPAHGSAVLEIKLKHPLLKDGAHVVMSPSNQMLTVQQIYQDSTEDVLPILLYAIGDDNLSSKDIKELAELKVIVPNLPVFFIRAFSPPPNELTESEQHIVAQSYHNQRQRWPNQRTSQKLSVSSLFSHSGSMTSGTPAYNLNLSKPTTKPKKDKSSSINLFQQLCDLGYLTLLPKNHRVRHRSEPFVVESELVDNFENFASILLFVRHILQGHLIKASTTLNTAHAKCLRMFILTAFDMARDMLITPRRIEYAKDKESELYESLLTIANKKQDEIRELIIETISSLKDDLLQASRNYEFKEIEIGNGDEFISIRDLKICTGEIQDLVLGRLNSAVAGKLIGSVEYLRESFIGTLERCLNSLEISCKDAGESIQATNALKQILNAAYHVEVTVRTSSSLIRVLWEKMKQLVQAMPWRTPPRINEEWKMRVASDMISSLSESRLAKSICSQFRERLKLSHEQFLSSLKQLELIHSGRLERTEEQRLKVRKVHAPKLARYALESTSLRDQILYGMPQMGREIGRGQYGVVFACDSWAGYSPCAIKSVVPPDDKHWNDLALEFYYTRSIPEHDRLVSLKGSVIDYTYGGGTTPAVLLVMERLQKDLYSAIKTGLNWISRLQVALDVVQGIRYLHGQGLVHRDIKLKNVLLDRKNRGKITDMGFCKPEAMMSGSIVGTPIHMAPELFTGRYDNSVDVYAFGILFWYICAGHVRLPYVFEQCQNKDQLWNCVRKGARPERLTQFDSECWQLMEQCWAGDPTHRPLLGNVEPRLQNIMEKYQTKENSSLSKVIPVESDMESLSTSPFIDIRFYDT